MREFRGFIQEKTGLDIPEVHKCHMLPGQFEIGAGMLYVRMEDGQTFHVELKGIVNLLIQHYGTKRIEGTLAIESDTSRMSGVQRIGSSPGTEIKRIDSPGAQVSSDNAPQ